VRLPRVVVGGCRGVARGDSRRDGGRRGCRRMGSFVRRKILFLVVIF
jgi:hypothetical protein